MRRASLLLRLPLQVCGVVVMGLPHALALVKAVDTQAPAVGSEFQA